MGSYITVYTTYSDSSYDFGGTLAVRKFNVRKAGIQASPDTMRVEFGGTGSVKRARMLLEPDIAIPLARNLLSVAEGYVSESITELA